MEDDNITYVPISAHVATDDKEVLARMAAFASAPAASASDEAVRDFVPAVSTVFARPSDLFLLLIRRPTQSPRNTLRWGPPPRNRG
jgi:hypothetical protein